METKTNSSQIQRTDLVGVYVGELREMGEVVKRHKLLPIKLLNLRDVIYSLVTIIMLFCIFECCRK